MIRTQSKEEASETHRTTISIRVRQNQLDLIDHAAKALDKNRSDFMLETACQKAESILLDRRFFHLTDRQFDEFLDVLDTPPKVNDKLSKLLLTAAPWE